MYVTHQHPSRCGGDQNGLDELQVLHRTCLLALRRYRQIHDVIQLGAIRGR